MHKKNILELCLAHGLGGLEMFVASCYDDFSQKTVCKVVVEKNSKLDNYLDIADKFYIKRSKLFPFLPALVLARYIDKMEIDIIHFHWSRDIITAVLAKLLSKRKPKLVQSRHMGMTRFKDDMYHKWLYKNIDMIHAVTNKVKEQLEKYIPVDVRPKLEMVYLGTKVTHVNTDIVKQLQEQYKIKDEFIVGIVGRIEKGKGQYKVIEAISNLQDINVKVIVVGSAMEEAYLKQLKQEIQKLGISERVIFTGFTKDVSEHMTLCNTIVLATENETFGLVVIEAMINKVAVIATNKGGPLEIINDGVDGILFDGTIEDLSSKIRKVYEDSHFRKKLEEEGYTKVQKVFNQERQIKKLFSIINVTIHNPTPTGI